MVRRLRALGWGPPEGSGKHLVMSKEKKGCTKLRPACVFRAPQAGNLRHDWKSALHSYPPSLMQPGCVVTLPPADDLLSLSSFGGEGWGEEVATAGGRPCPCLPPRLSPLPMNPSFVAADVRRLKLLGKTDIRSSLRRLPRFMGSKREIPFGGILSLCFAGGAREKLPVAVPRCAHAALGRPLSACVLALGRRESSIKPRLGKRSRTDSTSGGVS
jgi:hypothetical protein